MITTPDGMQMYGREAQNKNALSPSQFSLDPVSNVTVLSFLQREKQSFPMISRLDGRQMDGSKAHVLKAPSPSTLSLDSASNITVLSSLQSEKQRAVSCSMKDGIQTNDNKLQESKPPRLISWLPGSNVISRIAISRILVLPKQPSMMLFMLDGIHIGDREAQL
jgi:hypothetical protein